MMIEAAEKVTGHARDAIPAIDAVSPEPQTLPELFLRSVTEFDLPDALNYKRDGEWKKISGCGNGWAFRAYFTRHLFVGIEKR